MCYIYQETILIRFELDDDKDISFWASVTGDLIWT